MYRLIYVEPDSAVHETVRQALVGSPLPFAFMPVTDLDTAAIAARDRPVDAVLIALSNDAGAIATIGHCRSLFADQPLIVLTDAGDLAFARDALRAGAQDVVVKTERALAVLSRILLYAIERAGAEARRRRLEVETATLEALLDTLFAHTSDGLVQLDAAGTVRRLSASAADLLGLDRAASPGSRLATHLHQKHAPRLAALLENGRAAGEAAHATVSVAATSRLLAIEPLALDLETNDPPHLLRLAELAADFAGDDPPPAPAAAAPRSGRPVEARTTAPRRADADTAVLERPVEAPAAPSTAAATRPAALIAALDRSATWRVAHSTGESASWGFLVPDPKSAPAIARLGAVGRDDPEVALALDGLQLRAWQRLASDCPARLPARPALEVSYGTAASRSHLERYLADLDALPEHFAPGAHLVLVHAPKGIHVPTLGKTIRALEASRGKPALQLPDLDSDYRALILGQLALLILDCADLKRALAKDGKALSSFLARARKEGCATLVRGASGTLGEALRSRLGVDLTADG